MRNIISCFVMFFLITFASTATAATLSDPQGEQPKVQAFVPDSAYLADRERLDTLQYDSFLYMWEHSHPVSGMPYEAVFNWEVTPVAIGATGFGIAALITAVERGWITREQALHRLMTIVVFLRDKSDRKAFHGAFPHWLNGETGKSLPFSNTDVGADILETALLMQGLLLARQYFNGPAVEEELREIITELWHDVDWNWFTNNEENGLYWHWTVQGGFSNGLKILGNNECLIAYVLALASPTHPISRKAYNYWTSGKGYKSKMVFGYNIEAALAGAGPLFLAQYSFLGLDPRLMADAFVKDGYFVRNVKHTLSNRGYCLLTAPRANAYAVDYWGLTASKIKNGYAANEPKKDRATVAPTAALASMPYTPHYSLQVLEALRTKYKEQMWGPWGPYDAFSLRYKWFSTDYLAINQLPIVGMVENYRSALFWHLFMQDEDVKNGLAKAEIHEPEHKTGFPLIVRALKWKGERYVEDAYDIRRHPDSGLYQVPYFTNKADSVSLSVYDLQGVQLLQQKKYARAGHNIMSFEQFMPTTDAVLTLKMEISDGQIYELPIRLH